MQTSDTLDLIGNTPLVRLRGESIVAKAEFLNPGGSIKDRVALSMIEAAERDGRLKPGMKIVEPSSGNTGIGVTLVGVAKGHEVYVVMPDGMSQERRNIISVLGGHLILTPDVAGVAEAVRVAREFASQHGAFMPDQFKNPDNPKAHYEYTAPELWRQTGGKIDVFVAGVGSGGTIQGVGTFLKQHSPHIRIVAVEPANVAALLATSRACTRSRVSGTASSPTCSMSRSWTRSSRSRTTTPSARPWPGAGELASWWAHPRAPMSGPRAS